MPAIRIQIWNITGRFVSFNNDFIKTDIIWSWRDRVMWEWFRRGGKIIWSILECVRGLCHHLNCVYLTYILCLYVFNKVIQDYVIYILYIIYILFIYLYIYICVLYMFIHSYNIINNTIYNTKYNTFYI